MESNYNKLLKDIKESLDTIIIRAKDFDDKVKRFDLYKYLALGLKKDSINFKDWKTDSIANSLSSIINYSQNQRRIAAFGLPEINYIKIELKRLEKNGEGNGKFSEILKDRLEINSFEYHYVFFYWSEAKGGETRNEAAKVDRLINGILSFDTFTNKSQVKLEYLRWDEDEDFNNPDSSYKMGEIQILDDKQHLKMDFGGTVLLLHLTGINSQRWTKKKILQCAYLATPEGNQTTVAGLGLLYKAKSYSDAKKICWGKENSTTYFAAELYRKRLLIGVNPICDVDNDKFSIEDERLYASFSKKGLVRELKTLKGRYIRFRLSSDLQSLCADLLIISDFGRVTIHGDKRSYFGKSYFYEGEDQKKLLGIELYRELDETIKSFENRIPHSFQMFELTKNVLGLSENHYFSGISLRPQRHDNPFASKELLLKVDELFKWKTKIYPKQTMNKDLNTDFSRLSPDLYNSMIVKEYLISGQNNVNPKKIFSNKYLSM